MRCECGCRSERRPFFVAFGLKLVTDTPRSDYMPSGLATYPTREEAEKAGRDFILRSRLDELRTYAVFVR